VQRAIGEGFDEMELLKRYTTASMGPCQGRMCLMPLAACCAQDTGRTLADTGTTTSRPPVQPVKLGVLGGPHHHPVKLTPMHHLHVKAGARQMDMGDWKRPHTYTSPEEEWSAVRERVGLIDVSTLGKLDLKGRDAGRILDKVYTHVFSSLKVGRARYGVICGDDGIILDDGTVSRLAEEHYYLTTTTGNTEFVERWIGWWLAGTGLCAHVTNVTSDFAAVNLAGPKARDVLKKLTSMDVSSGAFKYMSCAQAEVAGVPARLLRIGFVGETGWEIHYPACHGEYLWETLLEAGMEFGILPFGVEAQRILRLEKKHIIVGQDTDALSNPFESDMAWVVKPEKADFIGKPGLLEAQRRGLNNKLVGFVTDRLVEEGSAIVVKGKPVGRVTSARLSPANQRCVGMAWVPQEISSEGSIIQIRNNGSTLAARVHLPPFYDPEGVRLKE
jgi:sarcosine oxidase subunit alpha